MNTFFSNATPKAWCAAMALTACIVSATPKPEMNGQIAPAAGPQVAMVDVAALLKSWQARLTTQGMTNNQVESWTRSVLPGLSTLSAERLAILSRAESISEFEAGLVKAPLESGTSLELYRASAPRDVSFYTKANSQKFGTENYEQLVFTPLTPCRIFDSRTSQGGAGPLANGVYRNFNVSGPYNSQGGSATNCGITAAANEIGALMVAVSTVSQNNPGYITLFPFGTSDPFPFGIAQAYYPGQVYTTFAVVDTDNSGSIQSRIASNGASTEAILDVVGYFARPVATALECTDNFNAGAGAWVNTTGFEVTAPTCASGYTSTGMSCGYLGNPPAGVYLQEGSSSYGYCRWHNASGSNLSGASLEAYRTCCRIPGR